MCNLYSVTKGQEAIVAITRAMLDKTGNMPTFPGIFPDYSAPIVRNHEGPRELAMARWGMPSPAFALKGRNSDPGITNVRNVKSPHRRRWLGVEGRWPSLPASGRRNGSQCERSKGETINDLFAFLTPEPNKEGGAIHPRAMPVIQTTSDEIESWMTAPAEEALKHQRPLPDGTLQILARGSKKDG